MKHHAEEKLSWALVAKITVVTVALIIAVLAFLAGLYFFMVRREAGRDPVPTWKTSQKVRLVGPALQTAERADLKKFRAQEEAILKSYAWEDKTNGIVRIPIERAMQMLSEKKND